MILLTDQVLFFLRAIGWLFSFYLYFILLQNESHFYFLFFIVISRGFCGFVCVA